MSTDSDSLTALASCAAGSPISPRQVNSRECIALSNLGFWFKAAIVRASLNIDEIWQLDYKIQKIFADL